MEKNPRKWHTNGTGQGNGRDAGRSILGRLDGHCGHGRRHHSCCRRWGSLVRNMVQMDLIVMVLQLQVEALLLALHRRHQVEFIRARRCHVSPARLADTAVERQTQVTALQTRFRQHFPASGSPPIVALVVASASSSQPQLLLCQKKKKSWHGSTFHLVNFLLHFCWIKNEWQLCTLIFNFLSNLVIQWVDLPPRMLTIKYVNYLWMFWVDCESGPHGSKSESHQLFQSISIELMGRGMKYGKDDHILSEADKQPPSEMNGLLRQLITIESSLETD